MTPKQNAKGPGFDPSHCLDFEKNHQYWRPKTSGIRSHPRSANGLTKKGGGADRGSGHSLALGVGKLPLKAKESVMINGMRMQKAMETTALKTHTVYPQDMWPVI